MTYAALLPTAARDKVYFYDLHRALYYVLAANAAIRVQFPNRPDLEVKLMALASPADLLWYEQERRDEKAN